ncbi:hypothetical protein MYX75_05790, partial [Acidobacteria bacterium AH-259-A15]|nr:hypothetical protein [Acidobacteria bacterium AH-259-A15]
METHFEKAGTYPTPGLIGRVIRGTAGVVILWMAFSSTLEHHEAFTRLQEGWNIPGIAWPPGVFLAVYLL